MIYNIKKRNTPIATLTKNFVNKRSGKVTESREEIQRRFDYLDWKDQKKIILAFLDSGKKDRQWAYAKTKMPAGSNHRPCPLCGKPSEELKWIYFDSPGWTWQQLCGRAGPMSICPDCGCIVEFDCFLLN